MIQATRADHGVTTPTQPGIRAVVFDLDGVLIDSAACHRAAFEVVLRPFGIRDFVYSRYAGWRTEEVVEHVLRQANCAVTPDLVSGVAREKSRLARAQLSATNPIAPGCLATLQQLSLIYVLALASSGSRPSVESFLATNQCARFFRSVLCGQDVQKAKPDPEIYERTFLAMGVPPGACVVIEDAVAGVVAARSAGARAVVGIPGTSSATELIAAGAAHLVQTLSDLPHLLSSFS